MIYVDGWASTPDLLISSAIPRAPALRKEAGFCRAFLDPRREFGRKKSEYLPSSSRDSRATAKHCATLEIFLNQFRISVRPASRSTRGRSWNTTLHLARCFGSTLARSRFLSAPKRFSLSLSSGTAQWSNPVTGKPGLRSAQDLVGDSNHAHFVGIWGRWRPEGAIPPPQVSSLLMVCPLAGCSPCRAVFEPAAFQCAY